MTSHRHGSSVIEFPNELEVVVKRDFEAPIQLLFDVLWKPEHLRRTIAPFGEEVTVCEVDLRVGGGYRYVFVTDDGFDGWPDAEAVETMELHETDGGTAMTWTLAFRDQAGRDHMTKYDGIEANFDNVDNYLRSLLDAEGTA